METVYIGIGSNIDAETNLNQVAQLLRDTFPGIIFSSVYKSAPMYEEKQDMFLNAVAKFKSEKSANDLHTILMRIEDQLKKHPVKVNGPRTIDLDILLFGDQMIHAAEDRDLPLHIPHPKMGERKFVLEPLCELMDENERVIWEESRKTVQNQICEKTDISL